MYKYIYIYIFTSNPSPSSQVEGQQIQIPLAMPVTSRPSSVDKLGKSKIDIHQPHGGCWWTTDKLRLLKLLFPNTKKEKKSHDFCIVNSCYEIQSSKTWTDKVDSPKRTEENMSLCICSTSVDSIK